MDRAAYILAASLVIILVLAPIHYIGEWRQHHEREAERLEREVNEAIEQLYEVERERDQAREEAEQLTLQLNQRADTERMVARAHISRRGRQEFNPFSNSALTAAALERAFEQMAPGMVGTGEALVQAEDIYGINALVLAGICHLESNGGMSYYARNRNNLAGLGAYTSNPDNAFRYETREDSIFALAWLLSEHYVPGGKFYGGKPGLEGIGVFYAADPRWAEKVSARMAQIMDAINRDGG